MKKRFKLLGVSFLFSLFLQMTLAGIALAIATAVPVSPGDAAGTAVTDQVCPTFSWSSADGAVSYRVELYEQVTSDLLAYDAITTVAKPVGTRDIAAPALSWTPGSGECLSRGIRYVWYVRGTDQNGEGQWSEGRAFEIEASALSLEQRDAVEEVLKEYLAKESAKAAGSSGIANAAAGAAVIETPSAAAIRTDGAVRQAQSGSSPGVSILDDLNLSGNLNLPGTTTTTGIIKSGANTLIHAYGTGNFFAGANAGNLTMTGFFNTAAGDNAFHQNTSGNQNTASGAFALSSNTTGSYNTAYGYNALSSNDTGYGNTANGIGALESNITANKNTALGAYALSIQSYPGTGPWDSDNTAVGYQALCYNQPTSIFDGIGNTALGSMALYNNNTGYYNTASGANALSSNDTGYGNTASGYSALYANTTGVGNTANGLDSLHSNTIGSENTASGSAALFSNTTANRNTALGTSALQTQSYNNGGTAWNSDNTAVGYKALYLNQPPSIDHGVRNTALGSQALYSNTTGFYNTASGYNALYPNQTGGNNTAMGYGSLWGNNNTAGNGNSGFGAATLYSITTGDYNTAIGHRAGYNLTTGSNNTYIGYDVVGLAGESNVVRIGNDATDTTYIAGIYESGVGNGFAVYVNANGQLGTLISSRRFKESIQDMGHATDKLMKLRPVTFYYKPEYASGPRLMQYGLIAEEVAEVYPDLVAYDNTGEPYTVYYQFINAMLLNEMQKQHKKIADLEERLARLEALVGQPALSK